MMDGYTLMAKMRKARTRFRLTPTEQALFTELVWVCNREGWEDVFYCSNEDLRSALFVSENTIVKARTTLINSGLIFYKSGKSKRAVCMYSFSKPFKTTSNFEVDSCTNDCTNSCTNAEGNSSDSYKLKKETKTISLSTGEQKVICHSLFEVMEKIISDQVWIEPVCMNNHKTLTEVHDLIKVFFSELQAREDYHKEEREAKDHFAKWLNIQVNQEKKKGGSNEKNRKSDTGRVNDEFFKRVAQGVARAEFNKHQ